MSDGKASNAAGKFPYAEIAMRPLSLVRRHPVIWLLAIFAGVGSGGSGFSATFPNIGTISRGDAEALKDPGFLGFLASGVDWLTDNVSLLIMIFAVVFIVWVILWLISVLFGAAAIHASADADKETPVGWRSSVSRGKASFWRYLALVVVFDVARLLVVALATLPVFLYLMSRLNEVELHALTINEAIAEYIAAALQLISDPWVMVVGLLAALAAFLLTLVLAVTSELSARALILEEMDAAGAIRRAVSVIRRNLGRTGLVTLIGGLASAIGSTILAIFIVVALFALIPVGILLFSMGESALAVSLSWALTALIAFLLLAMALGGLLGAYFSAFWTVAYRRLIAGEV